MTLLEALFWLLAAFVGYTYVGYPLLLFLLGRVWPRPQRRDGRIPRSVSVVITARDEAQRIGRKLVEMTSAITQAGLEGEVIVVSDGSTDGTAKVARRFASRGVRVIELPTNQGKAAALTAGCLTARHAILLLADTRQSWAPDAIPLLLENFADPAVGAATGDLVVESAPGVLAGVGLYWRYEKNVRRLESRLSSPIGATGAISALRRSLFQPIPRGTLLDDVYWPSQVVLQGYRVVHDSRARAYDVLPPRVSDEFRRKVRTLSGNFQLVALLPSLLLPWRNPLCWQFWSHKIFRLLVPWALLGLLVVSCSLEGPVYRVALVLQIMFYALGAIGMVRGNRSGFRLAAAGGSFLVLNAAAWIASWKWVTGRVEGTWGKVAYPEPEIARG
jgi:cellulose synthase/poly-beta-1,6-N-acetylglucosamine synthase-like glycosyltransferase